MFRGRTSVPDPAKSYWRVGSRDKSEHASLVVLTAGGRHIATFLSADLALAAVGAHNRALKSERVVVLDPGLDADISDGPPAVGLTTSEVEWLQSAAERGAFDTIVPGAADELRALAAKLASLTEDSTT